jgi:hypothetical protein
MLVAVLLAATEFVAVGIMPPTTVVASDDVVGVERTGALAVGDEGVGAAVEHAATPNARNVIQKTRIDLRFIFSPETKSICRV